MGIGMRNLIPDLTNPVIGAILSENSNLSLVLKFLMVFSVVMSPSPRSTI